MKINFTSFATTFSLVFSFILCFSLHYNETEKLSSVIKPLVRNYIANWELGQANISINVLSSENSRISSFAIYRKKSESIIFGDKWVIKEIDKPKFHFSDGLYIYPNLNFIKIIDYPQNDIGICVKFTGGYFVLYFLLSFSITCGILHLIFYVVRAKSENKIQEEKIRNQNEKNEFLNSVSHEICAGLENGGYTDIRVRNLKALLLLADQPIDKKYVELKSLVEDLVNEYSLNSKFNLIFEYPETLTVSDQPLGLILTNLITNCSKNNAFGKAQLSTHIDAQSLIFKLRNNVGKICSQGKIERFHKQTNRTGLSLVRKSLAFLGIGIENLHIVPTDRYTDVVVKIPLNSVAIEDDASRLPIETRVAIIDDDKGYRDSLFERLQSLGIEPTPYSHVDYFYDDVVAGKIFDIAIVDRHGDQLESPDMDEWDAVKHNFCNSARKYGYKGKIILFSNAAVGAQGFDEILSKEVYNDWGNIISRVLQSK